MHPKCLKKIFFTWNFEEKNLEDRGIFREFCDTLTMWKCFDTISCDTHICESCSRRLNECRDVQDRNCVQRIIEFSLAWLTALNGVSLFLSTRKTRPINRFTSVIPRIISCDICLFFVFNVVVSRVWGILIKPKYVLLFYELFKYIY